jgi:hypothetical protein
MTPTSGAFELRLGAGNETGLLIDRRVGFTHALPGRPKLVPPAAQRNEARVSIGEAPITVRYRLERLPMAPAAAALAKNLAQTYGQMRAGVPVTVRAAEAPRSSSWGVAAAASVSYALARPTTDADTERLTVLVRPVGPATCAMHITETFNALRVGTVPWNMFTSATTFRWSPDAPTTAVPQVWPDSTYLRPGILGDLLPERVAMLPRIREALSHVSVAPLRSRLTTLLLAPEPAATPLSANAVSMRLAYLSDGAPDRDASLALREVLADVRTIHDARGAALLLMRALPAQ